MGLTLKPFRTANERILGQCGYMPVQTSENYTFSYNREGRDVPLFPKEINGDCAMLRLEDTADGFWSIDEAGLDVEFSMKLRNPRALFGPAGVVPEGTRLGLALQWVSSESRQKGTVKGTSFDMEDENLVLKVSLSFEKGQLRTQVSLLPVLYIEQCDGMRESELHLANEPGTIVGSLENEAVEIRFSGDGSMFPYYEIPMGDDPLWTVRCDWADPSEDEFSECVGLYINTEHPDYKLLKMNDQKSFSMPLFNQIVTSAVFTILCKLNSSPDDWRQAISGVELSEGSVSQAVYYFHNMFDWDMETPEALLTSIQHYFEKEMPK